MRSQVRDAGLSRLWALARFVNTHDRRSFGPHRHLDDGKREHLRTRADLERFLRAEGLLVRGRPVSEADLMLARSLRQALRGQLDVVGPNHARAAAARTLSKWTASLAMHVRFEEAPRLHARDDARGALALLMGGAALAEAAGVWPRLKVCSAPDCGWAYVDESKNRLGRWCSMAACGGRMKSRAFRARLGV